MIFEQKYKSKQVQKSDQNFSNIIMLNCLAALENLAIFCGYKGQKIFDYYSGFTPKDKIKDLVDDAVIQLEIFRASHSNYISNYCNYDFPGNLTKEQIIQIISEWKKFIPDNNIKVFYDEIIHYLNGNSNISGISGIIDERQKEWGPTTEAQLSRISNSIPFINSKMFNQMEQVQKSYNKNGDYEINAKLYKNRDDDIEMKKYYENDQKYMEKEQKFRNLEKKIESIFYTYISKNIRIKESDMKSLIDDLNLFEKYIKSMSLGEIEIKQKIELYENFSKTIQYKEYLEICQKIIACYKKEMVNAKDF
jgi:hypothetical protein